MDVCVTLRIPSQQKNRICTPRIPMIIFQAFFFEVTQRAWIQSAFPTAPHMSLMLSKSQSVPRNHLKTMNWFVTINQSLMRFIRMINRLKRQLSLGNAWNLSSQLYPSILDVCLMSQRFVKLIPYYKCGIRSHGLWTSLIIRLLSSYPLLHCNS